MATTRGASGQRTVAVAGLQILLLWTAVAIVIWYSHRNAVDDGKRTAESMSLTVAAYVKQTLDGADLIVKSIQDWIKDEEITSDSKFREVMKERRFFDAMRDRVVSQPQIAVAGIIARNGELLNNIREHPAPPVDLSEREAYTTPMAAKGPELTLTAPVPGRTTGRSTFYLVRKVTSKSGETLGLVVVGLDVEFLTVFFRRIAFGEVGGLTLFRDDGTVLVTSEARPDLLGKRYADALPRRLILEGQSGRAVFTDAPAWFDPEKRHLRLVVPQLVDGYPAFVSLVVGESVFLTRWREMSFLILALALALAAVTFLVTQYILRLLKQSEVASRAELQRDLLSAIVETPSALTAVVDRKGDVVHANTKFHEVFGTDAEIREALRGSNVAGVERIRDFIAGDARIAEVDLEIVRPGRQTQYFQFSLSRRALLDWGDCTIMVGHDETLRHQARQALTLTSKMVTMGEVTTGIAHELSQPLNVIRMAAQNALTEIEPEEAEDEDDPPPPPMPEPEFRRFVAGKLRRVVLQVDRAAEILARMRLFSRETRQGPQAFDIRDACRGAIVLAEPRLRRLGVSVRDILGDRPLMVVGHPTQIEQGIVSLLMNAGDALADSSRSEKIVEVRACAGGDDRVRVSVHDNGPGVPADIRDRIFEPFFTTKPVGQGTGLGLATTFGIIRDSGGTLTLADGGPGASFEIELPAAAAHPLAIPA